MTNIENTKKIAIFINITALAYLLLGQVFYFVYLLSYYESEIIESALFYLVKPYFLEEWILFFGAILLLSLNTYLLKGEEIKSYPKN